ncbi:DUF2024 family protein [Stieleria sp. ICT_E10.1]|uniref:DUF2024 family protein n=1 Tax=Stieleria sedimenti TaxID=2976331 RepID=UPI00217F5428|nr:DUF2024 family protein [Stieleria sedimenti]MCS7465398.1 DUF2024 family protein [Stieleria sedimenti]
MKYDFFDTYATDPDGTVLHFDAIVPAGTSQRVVRRLIHGYVGGDDPEIEIQRNRWKSSGHGRIDVAALAELQQHGFAVVPLMNRLSYAG